MTRPRHSSMEAWSYIARTQSARDSVEMYLPLMLSAAGALGVLPFAIIRWLDGDWIIAVIDTVIIVSFVSLGTYVYRTRNVRIASIALCFLGCVGVLATLYARGSGQSLWAYPALMLFFYLLRPREAITFTALMLVLMLPALYPAMDIFRLTSVVMTILVTSVFAYAFAIVNDRQRRDLIKLANKDPLTGAGNRRALWHYLDTLLSRDPPITQQVSLILFDLDHFKSINDQHGHAAGDRILCDLTDIVGVQTQRPDSIYRIGGEEFVVVVEDRSFEDALQLAEQMRALVQDNELVPDQSVTISVGIAEIRTGESIDDWLNRADKALYEAKRAGRNTIRKAG